MRGGDAVEGLLVAVLLPAHGEIVFLVAFEIGRRHGSADQASPVQGRPLIDALPICQNSGEANAGAPSCRIVDQSRLRRMRRRLRNAHHAETFHAGRRCDHAGSCRRTARGPSRIAAKEKPGRKGRVFAFANEWRRRLMQPLPARLPHCRPWRRGCGPLARLTSIRRTASVSDILLTAAISRAMRSSAAS